MGRAHDRESVDPKLEALQDEERRRVLFALLEAAPDESPADLGASLADGGQLPLTMFHTHLPKLESLGFIEHDPDGHRLSRGPKFGEIAPLLSVLAEHEDELPGRWRPPPE